MIKQKKKQLQENYLCTLKQLQKEKSSEFWKIINHMKDVDNKSENPISAKRWLHYYETLNVEKYNNDFQQNILTDLDEEENKLPDNIILNKIITHKEVSEAIRNLKSNKAPGLDGFCLELLKNSSSYLMTPLVKLFNLVLDSSEYPDLWNLSCITHIHKKGDKFEPQNYRGISVSSCIGKVLCYIINKRINSYIEEKKILKNNQAGFRKNHRTIDQIFVLKTLVQKYIKNKQKLFVCFVDFAKAFDTVWREGLFYKLLINNINGKIYKLIKNNYSNTKACININNYITNQFKINRGVKQGCIMSPTLFNIFINDLKDNLDEVNTDSPLLNNTIVNSVLYADDLALISTTQAGLQTSLNALEQYCAQWKLAVNLSKTQVVIFSSSYLRQNYSFSFGNQNIQIGTSYTYLGIAIKSNGSFKDAMSHLATKAGKSIHIMNNILNGNIDIELKIRLFNIYIKPILLYGSELWALETNIQENAKWDKTKILRMNLRFCKQILQTSTRSCNLAVRAELGQSQYLKK